MTDDVAARREAAGVRWFGEAWNARVCAPDLQIGTPATPCGRCRARVLDGQRGVVIGSETMHLTCLLAYLGEPQRHVLQEGVALCRFIDAPPVEWPEGHSWVYAGDWPDATCEGCVEIVSETPPSIQVRHGVVMPWPKGWGPAIGRCEWRPGCARPPVVARYDGVQRCAWVPCCLECSKERKEE